MLWIYIMRRRSNVLAGRHSADPVEPVIWLWYSDVEFINRPQGSRACTPQRMPCLLGVLGATMI